MSNRNLVRQALVKAWHKTIASAYVDRLINSERSLQAYFGAELIREFKDQRTSRTIMIEPRLRFEDGSSRLPDLVICNRDKAIAIVELKYGPRGTPSPGKDLKTLVTIHKESHVVTLENQRYLGPTKSKTFWIAKDAVMCWAVVCKEEPIPLPPAEAARLGSRLMHLQALTHANKSPTILPALRKS